MHNLGQYKLNGHRMGKCFSFIVLKKPGRLSKEVSELKEFELFVFVATILTFNVSALYSFCHFFPFEKRALQEIIEAKICQNKICRTKMSRTAKILLDQRLFAQESYSKVP